MQDSKKIPAQCLIQEDNLGCASSGWELNAGKKFSENRLLSPPPHELIEMEANQSETPPNKVIQLNEVGIDYTSQNIAQVENMDISFEVCS